MTRDEIISALNAEDFEPYRILADNIRRENIGDYIDIRAILEYSNYCVRCCKYCGLNCYNKSITRYRLSDDVIVELAKRAADVGYKTLVMQGGEDPVFDRIHLGELVKEIAKTGIAITLSAGELNYDDYRYLRECGADRYLLKHETANSKIYDELHGDYPLARRIECLRNIKSLGYETGSGFMVGLPNQTIPDLADDLLMLQSLECDMAGIGPYIPHPDTPLANELQGSAELTRRLVALARIMMPQLHLPATTSLHVVSGSSSGGVFDYGANVIMRKITPTAERKLYEIYPSKKADMDIVAERRAVEDLIKSEGKIPR